MNGVPFNAQERLPSWLVTALVRRLCEDGEIKLGVDEIEEARRAGPLRLSRAPGGVVVTVPR